MFMSRKKGVLGIIFSVMLVFLLCSFPHSSELENAINQADVTLKPEVICVPLAGIPHSPIEIDSDAEFATMALAEGWPGDGTTGNPYTIDGYDIDAGGSMACIRIRYTRVSFTISDCNLHNAGYGIQLDDVYYGIIAGNTITTSDGGAYLYFSHFNTIVNNSINTDGDDKYGIRLYNSDNNTCSHNSMQSMYLDTSDSNTVASNLIIGSNIGLRLLDSNLNVLLGNRIESHTYCGIELESSVQNIFRENEIALEGYAINLLTGVAQNVFSWNALESLSNLNHIDSDLLTANSFEFNYYSDYWSLDPDENGIGETAYVSGSPPVVVDQYPLIYPPGRPRWTEQPSDLKIEYGGLFRYDLNVTTRAPITWSLSSSPFPSFFTIDSEGVILSQLRLPRGLYVLNVTVTNIYDFSLSTKIRITVMASEPPVWLVSPTDQLLSFGDELDYEVAALDPSGISIWDVNDTDNFVLSYSNYLDASTACITNNSILESGIYGLNISVYDSYGNRLSSVFTITVEPPEQDTAPPEWVIPPTDQTLRYGYSLVLQIAAWDASGISHWWINDTEHFSMDENMIIKNATSLEPGVYRLEVRAYDPYDNYCSATLVLTVIESTLTTPTTGPSPGGVDPVMALVLGAGIGGAAVVIIIMVVLSRKS